MNAPLPVLVLVLLTIAFSYACFTIALHVFWGRIKTGNESQTYKPLNLSVVVPVRNEARNILLLLEDLEKQTLPTAQFEVLIMDDSSTDGTAQLVTEFAHESSCDIRLITLPDIRSASPKKRAIETAIQHAKGDIIVTTDGDCRVSKGWLEAVSQAYASPNVKLVSAPVTFSEGKSLTDYLQTVEFASLIGSGASAIAAGYPSMCNGANLSYRKKAFLKVGGYDGVRHIASGDDEFLMHKMAAAFPGAVHFLKSREAIVTTRPHNRWSDFFRQRKRWASKWKHYQSKTPLALALYVFTANLSLIAAEIFWLSGHIDSWHFVFILAAKCVPEWLFLGSVLNFLGRKKAVLFIPVTQVIYPFYVCFFGLAAQGSSYYWKGRKLV